MDTLYIVITPYDFEIYRLEDYMLNLTERKKNIFLTILSNLLLQFVTVVCGFILPPLIVSFFGSSMNGMVSSITQFIAYLNIVEAGVGGAAIASMYKPLAENDVSGQNGILSAVAKFFIKSGLMFCGLIIFLAVFYPLCVNSEVNAIISGTMVLVLGITGIAEFFLVGKYRVLLTADKKSYVLSLTQVGAIVLNTFISVVLIRWGLGIVIVKLIASLAYLSRYCIIFLYVKRRYPQLDFHVAPDNAAISQSKNVLVHQIGGLVVFNAPFVILTIFCSLSDVSVYSIYAMVFSGLNGILASFSNGLQAFFGESLITEDLGQTRRIFSKFENIFFTVTGWMYSMTYILIMPFMHLYTKNMTDADYIQPMLAFLLVLSGIANQLRRPCDLMITASGHFKQTQWRSMLESAINIITSIVFVLWYGFVGVVFGALCSFAYRTLDIIIYTDKNILKRSPFVSFMKIIVMLIAYIFSLLVVHFFCFFSVQTYLEWIVYASLIGCILAIPLIMLVSLFSRLNT